MTTLPPQVPVYLEWRDDEDKLRRQAVTFSLFAVGQAGVVEPVAVPLPERGQLVLVDYWRPSDNDGQYRRTKQWLYVVSAPRWTLAEYGQALPDQPQMLREVSIFCEAADDEQEARRG